MKKVLFITTTAIIVMACGGGSTEAGKEVAATATTAATTSGNALSDNPDYQKGLALVAGSDCLTCHKTSEKNIGPAYKEVAAKYENTEENVKMLAGKIIKGGSGNWGAIPMTPHPQLKEEDVEQMVKYILLLKK
jgi:cytochrome c